MPKIFSGNAYFCFVVGLASFFLTLYGSINETEEAFQVPKRTQHIGVGDLGFGGESSNYLYPLS